MPYTVSASERTTGLGNDNETKALLYLLSFAPECQEIDYVIIDFFNDVTGSNSHARRLWDAQSKKSLSNPSTIGAELVTLYKNHTSEISGAFSYKILVLGGVTNSVRKDSAQKEFSYADMKDAAKQKVREGLLKECLAKTYISNELACEKTIGDFLDEVLFVISDHPKADYIKPLVKVSPTLMPDDRTLEGIFDEIRNRQSAKKNTLAEGVTITVPSDVFYHCRHLGRKEIEQLVLLRIINNGNPFAMGTPLSFLALVRKFPPDKEADAIEDCEQELALQMCDKNSRSAFWELFEAISIPLLADSQHTIEDVYKMIDESVLDACTHLGALSTKFFIAVVKDGLK
jgi:hypothetical protein